MADPEQVQIELHSEKSEKAVGKYSHHSEKLEKSLKIFKILTIVGFLLAIIFLIVLIVVAATKDEKIIHENEQNAETTMYNVWEQLKSTGNVPDIRLAHGSAVYNKEMLIFYGLAGSETDDIMRSDIWSYSPTKKTWNQWNTSGTAPSGRYHFGSAIYDGYLYMHGGFLNFEGEEEASNEFFRLSLTNRTWEELTIKDKSIDQPAKRGAHEIVVHNGIIYLFGGSETVSSGLFDDLWTYDISKKTWKEIQFDFNSEWPSPRLGFNFYDADNYIWLFAGTCTMEFEPNCDNGQQNDLWIFYPDNSTWKELTPTGNIPKARRASHAEITVSNHSFLVGGLYLGSSGPEMLNDVHVYDIDTNRWVELHPEWPDETETIIMTKRFGHSVEEIDNKIYVFGGRCGNPKVNGCNDLWVYTPPLFAHKP